MNKQLMLQVNRIKYSMDNYNYKKQKSQIWKIN